jgi:uncharacterized protein YcnI
MKAFATKFIATCALSMPAAAVFAHISLERGSAEAGSSYKAVLRVGHGCDGAPTTGITVQVPAGFQGAKPMPKPGWQLATRSSKLAAPYSSHGREVTEDVVEVRWTAASAQAALPAAHYDEFVLFGTLPAGPGPLWFKVLQTCEAGRNDWSQVPTEGTSTQGLRSPAALLLVLPAGTAPHQH